MPLIPIWDDGQLKTSANAAGKGYPRLCPVVEGFSVTPRRDEDPKTLDPGRVGLAMRARQQGDDRYPFVRRPAVRRRAVLVAVAVVVLAVALVFFLAR